MTDAERDRELGLDRPITRRDFLSGFAVAAGAAISSSMLAKAARAAVTKSAGGRPMAPPAQTYPPSLAGLRGDHPGSFELAHALRYGKAWKEGEDTGEHYDLIVVGGGLSGLAAAYFYRKAHGPQARMLIFDNHDDFGGQAKRNEFRYRGRVIIGYGGTESIDAPASFTAGGKALLRDIGVDLKRFYKAYDLRLYRSRGLTRGVFFDRETFGADRLAVGEPPGTLGQGPHDWGAFLARTPLPEAARRDVLRINEEQKDALPGLSKARKIERLGRTSYRDYLLKIAKVHPLVAAYLQKRTHNAIALGADAVSAWWCYNNGLPGFWGLGLDPPSEVQRDDEPYIFHFPDGCASVARLLVRWLIPGSLPGRTMEDSVTARADYARLDEPASPCRVRLSSTVANVRQRKDGQGVEVTYVQHGRAFRATAARCVLACQNTMAAHVCPELPEGQKQALRMAVRSPVVYTNVLLRDSKALQRLGVCEIHCPGGYHSDIAMDFPVSMGIYRFGGKPEDPVLLHLLRVPLQPGLPARDQFHAGRVDLLMTSFEKFERATRDQLARVLKDGGFDPARNIAAITVNRWPHGYAMGRNTLFDPDWTEEDAPWVLGRRRFGRITIANSDAGAVPLMQSALEQAQRAVDELVSSAYPITERI